MKKIVIIGLTVLATLSLTACSSKTKPEKHVSSTSNSSSATTKNNNAETIVDNLNLVNVKNKKDKTTDKLTDYENNAAKLKENGFVVIVNGDFLFKEYKAVETNLSALGLKVSSVESGELGTSNSGKVEKLILPDQISFTTDYLGYWYYVTPKSSKAIINYYK